MGELGGRRTGRARARPRLAAVAVLALAVAGLTWSRAAADGECRITGGHAAVLVGPRVPNGPPVYEGVMFVVTRDCGTGPKSVSGSFTPVNGTPATCAPAPSVKINEAVCSFTGSVGIGLPGSVVMANATATIAGLVKEQITEARNRHELVEAVEGAEVEPGVGRRASLCAITLPEAGGRHACTLF